MTDKNMIPASPAGPSAPGGPDLDDLIFQGESWLVSDR